MKRIKSKNKLVLIIGLIIFLLGTSSCTENQRARKFGGRMEINVPRGMKVTMATWKRDDLFYMLEPMDSGYVPTTKRFIENSSFGVFETEVIFNEWK